MNYNVSCYEHAVTNSVTALTPQEQRYYQKFYDRSPDLCLDALVNDRKISQSLGQTISDGITLFDRDAFYDNEVIIGYDTDRLQIFCDALGLKQTAEPVDKEIFSLTPCELAFENILPINEEDYEYFLDLVKEDSILDFFDALVEKGYATREQTDTLFDYAVYWDDFDGTFWEADYDRLHDIYEALELTPEISHDYVQDEEELEM